MSTTPIDVVVAEAEEREATCASPSFDSFEQDDQQVIWRTSSGKQEARGSPSPLVESDAICEYCYSEVCLCDFFAPAVKRFGYTTNYVPDIGPEADSQDLRYTGYQAPVYDPVLEEKHRLARDRAIAAAIQEVTEWNDFCVRLNDKPKDEDDP